LIIDTDAGFDVDDIGALSVGHHLADQGKCDLIATISSVGCNKSIAGVSVINEYYGRGDIQLGAYKGPFGRDCGTQDNYLDDIINRYPHTVKNYDGVPDAVDAYIKVLSA
jgi:hypothetical protein